MLAITGATGWVGRTAVAELARLLPHPLLAERLWLFASCSGSIQIGDRILPVHPLRALPELATTHSLAAVMHTAFLTRDRLAVVGQEAYVATNRWITQQVAEALSLAPAARAVVISSGAAADYDAGTDPNSHLEADPYGVLKREEELVLARLASCLVLRIYALSGYFIRDPARFALGDFLLSALQGQPIRIKASMPVLRSYGHAGDITALAWRWLLSDDDPLAPQSMPAVSAQLNLFNLAQRITELYSLPPVQATIDPLAAANIYLSDSAPFLEALARFGLSARSLNEQVRDTAAGLIANPDGTLGR